MSGARVASSSPRLRSVTTGVPAPEPHRGRCVALHRGDPASPAERGQARPRRGHPDAGAS